MEHSSLKCLSKCATCLVNFFPSLPVFLEVKACWRETTGLWSLESVLIIFSLFISKSHSICLSKKKKEQER